MQGQEICGIAFELTMTDMKTNELDNKIIIYQTDDGKTQLDVKLENETVWLTQAQMAELFQKTGRLSDDISATSLRKENLMKKW